MWCLRGARAPRTAALCGDGGPLLEHLGMGSGRPWESNRRNAASPAFDRGEASIFQPISGPLAQGFLCTAAWPLRSSARSLSTNSGQSQRGAAWISVKDGKKHLVRWRGDPVLRWPFTALPFGKWTCADGREVLYNRDYVALWQRRPGEPAEQADP